MTKQIKSITVVTSNYPSSGHVANVFVQQLVHAMIDQGVKVTVVAYQSIVHELFHGEKILPMRSIGVTEGSKKYEIYRPFTISTGNRDFAFVKWLNKKIVTSTVKKLAGDIIYCHFWSSALPVYEYALRCKKPLFVACGEGDNAIEDMVATMPKEQLERLAKACTGVVSVSSENKRKCIDFNLAKAEDIEVFPNCVNTDVFHKMEVIDMKQRLGIKEDDFVISFVGSFVSRKGPDRVAQAIRNLNDPNIKIMFIGKHFPGYEYNFDCPGIIHKGLLGHELLPQYENCADIFVLPTQKEGCCNAIVEALAMGLPVISSDGSFNDDILDERNSIRVDPNDVEAITEAIRTLRDNKELRQSMAKYSLSRHEEYAIEGRAKRIMDFISKHIENENNCNSAFI